MRSHASRSSGPARSSCSGVLAASGRRASRASMPSASVGVGAWWPGRISRGRERGERHSAHCAVSRRGVARAPRTASDDVERSGARRVRASARSSSPTTSSSSMATRAPRSCGSRACGRERRGWRSARARDVTRAARRWARRRGRARASRRSARTTASRSSRRWPAGPAHGGVAGDHALHRATARRAAARDRAGGCTRPAARGDGAARAARSQARRARYGEGDRPARHATLRQPSRGRGICSRTLSEKRSWHARPSRRPSTRRSRKR